MKTNAGTLRQQSALLDADTPIIIVTEDKELRKFLQGRNIKVVEFYPDTTDGEGNFNRTFKIKVAVE